MKTITVSPSGPLTLIQHPMVMQLWTISASKSPEARSPDSSMLAASSAGMDPDKSTIGSPYAVQTVGSELAAFSSDESTAQLANRRREKAVQTKVFMK